MSSDLRFEFTKENIDIYLKELGKEYRRQSGKGMPAELILIGGASVLINYGFRNMTTDVDAVIQAASGMKDAINAVRDRYGLPNHWLNDDFKNTSSYTPKLIEFSVYYKTFSNVLSIRTIASEYLIAMKLRSGRQYKSDLSDVLGILAEHEKEGTPLSMKQIRKAVTDLYGDWNSLPNASQVFIENVMENSGFEQLYEQITREEQETKELLIQLEENYPGIITRANMNGIAENLQEKADRASILARLRQKKSVDTKITDEKKSGD
ncbi:MAG: DUF6036 family nucleotidyltransferase [Hornefia butyriciproducens]|uniref:DUF6036 family nucleotidyltransferase n=1 Tax=Hornefia butyriciproducens TaxID=2652293 RepID=UPI002A747C2C|nr:DUF6036 family nucleotidyltransferase [Hornefia butyriciproducens]MDY2990871.1 DUF6036 family nucleotidyltransferase [Hornefia butyriciproducens]